MATDPSSIIAGLLQSGANVGQSVGQGFTQGLQDQNDQTAVAMNALKLQGLQQQTANNAEYQSDVAGYEKNPTMDGLAHLAIKYPDHAEAIKQFWAIKDPEVRQSHITALAQPLSALENSKPDLAIQSLQQVRDAARARGEPTDDIDSQIAALQSGDKDSINTVKAGLMMHLAAADPEGKFAESLAKLKTSVADTPTKGTVVGRAIGHYDDDGKWQVDYRDPESAQYRTIDGVDEDGNPIKQLVQVGGNPAGGSPAGTTPAAGSGSGAPLSVRLNNPGAIRFDPKNQWQGQVGNSGGFVQFDTPANGLRAHRILIANQIKEGYDTPAAWAAHYAPAEDGNDPAAYAQTIASGLGIGVHDKIPLGAVSKVASLSAGVEAGGSPPANASTGAAPTAIVGSPSTPGVRVLYTSKTAGATGLDAGTIDFYGQKVAAGGDMPQFGMGKQAAAMRQAVLARSAQIQQSQGMSGGDSNLLHADVKTATTALGALQKTRNSLNPFLQTFDGASAQVRQLAPQGVGGSAPIFNRWIQAGRTSVSGDPAVSKFNVAINAVANENAKIMSGASGGAVSSDSARAEAMHLINNAQTLDQLNATLDQMHTDTQIRVKSLDDRQAQLRNIVAGKGSGSSTTVSQAGPNSAAAPRVGSVARGFRFNGGNPADRNNWVKVQ